MDRFETVATADANGDVHVHVGVPGVRVRVVAEAVADAGEARRAWMAQVYGSLVGVHLERPDQPQPEVREVL